MIDSVIISFYPLVRFFPAPLAVTFIIDLHFVDFVTRIAHLQRFRIDRQRQIVNRAAAPATKMRMRRNIPVETAVPLVDICLLYTSTTEDHPARHQGDPDPPPERDAGRRASVESSVGREDRFGQRRRADYRQFAK